MCPGFESLIRHQFLLLAVLLGASSVAQAQLRTVPPDARPAYIRYVDHLTVQVGTELRRLSPGVLIRDQSNRMVLPGTLASGAAAAYQLDDQGYVHRIWILTPQEAEARARGSQ